MDVEELVNWRRDLHQIPELGLKEYQTKAYLKKELEKMGYHPSEILETGLYIYIDQGKEETIAFRTDMDALPITEKNDIPFKSKHEGCMHACGHDTHYVSLMGAATVLAEIREEIQGSVKFIFQPAEEHNFGAQHLITLGCLENPRPVACFSFHNSPEIPTGTVAVVPGPIMAGLHTFEITLTGKGGHGGIPHLNVDPVVGAAALIQSFQTIVSRNIAPVHAAVISVCSVHTDNGHISNVVPNQVNLMGTVRYYSYEDKALIKKRMQEITDGICSAYHLTGELVTSQDLPITTNTPLEGQPSLYPIALAAAKAAGATPVEPEPSGGGDDFSYYSLGVNGKEGVPSYFYWLGVGNEEKDCVYAWHSPHFKADTDILRLGAGTYALSVFTGIEAVKRGLPDEQDLSKL